MRSFSLLGGLVFSSNALLLPPFSIFPSSLIPKDNEGTAARPINGYLRNLDYLLSSELWSTLGEDGKAIGFLSAILRPPPNETHVEEAGTRNQGTLHRSKALELLFEYLISNRTLHLVLPYIPEDLRPIIVGFFPCLELRKIQHTISDYVGDALLHYHQTMVNLTFSLIEEKDMAQEIQLYPDFMEYALDMAPRVAIDIYRFSEGRHEFVKDFNRVLVNIDLKKYIEAYIPQMPQLNVEIALSLATFFNLPKVLQGVTDMLDDLCDSLGENLEKLKQLHWFEILDTIVAMRGDIQEALITSLPKFLLPAVFTKEFQDILLKAFTAFVTIPWNWIMIRRFFPLEVVKLVDVMLVYLNKPTVIELLNTNVPYFIKQYPTQIKVLLETDPRDIQEVGTDLLKAYPNFDWDINHLIRQLFNAMMDYKPPKDPPVDDKPNGVNI